MKAAVFYGANQPLKIEDVPIPQVSPNEALVKVAACGVCHTDLHYLDGVPTFKKPPLILGHEVSGIIAKMGDNVTKFKIDDRVLIPPMLTCGECPACRMGRDNLCQNMIMIGNSIDGAYAEYIKVPAKDIISLPPELPLEKSAVISDAMSTPYHALKNRAKIQPGESVAIYGAGGVGLNAVQIANAFGAFVVAVDIRDEKLQLAKDLGADELINSTKEDPVKAVRKMTKGGADVALEVVGIPEIMTQAYESVRWGGRVVIIGYTAKNITISGARLMFREITVMGSLGCRVADYPSLVDLVRRGKLKLLVSNEMRLEEINEALQMLREGKIPTRAIVIP